jgi:hypothetical protein
MNEKNPLDFGGKGFSQEDFTAEERAQMRERHHFFDRHFLSVDDFLEHTGLTWVSKMARGFPAFVKMFATISVIGGAYIMGKQLGIF